MKGTLFALEGIGCSGKSTCIRSLKEMLGTDDYIYTREPGGTPYGEQLRAALLAPKPASKETKCFEEMLPMMADRAYHVRTHIEPALARGQQVITDRFYGSTWAYQVFDRGSDVDKEIFAALRDRALGNIKEADVHWIYFDLPVDVSLKRRCDKEDDVDQFDDQAVAFWERVRNGYEDFFADRDHFRVDATGTPEEIVATVHQYIIENSH